ncbi:dipicolinic acid synthetase subunit A [Paraliobacillus sp. JSM ZJ581]|uniref:dipicolinic acid synthetase subunit A n=1 Tax=Paraliobacillus sp. JSM ZJ581 TaxID=3342118 RepID=UPI0035A8B893
MDQLHIAILGGDARYLEMIKKLSEDRRIKMELVGFNQLNQGFTGIKQTDFSSLEVEKLDAVILPIPGIDKTGSLHAVFSNEEIYLSEHWFSRIQESSVVFTGISTPYLEKMKEMNKLKLIPLMDRDDVAIYNSIPTAEGTIMLAIQNTNFTVHESTVLVLGFGRVGMSVASKFKALGANVFVGARKTADFARINEMGMGNFHMNDLAAYTGQCDILINTIPVKVVTAPVLNPLKSNALIIDLASKPGGVDFEYAKQRGIHAIHALGLPGMVAPRTAGEILANIISQLIFTH